MRTCKRSSCINSSYLLVALISRKDTHQIKELFALVTQRLFKTKRIEVHDKLLQCSASVRATGRMGTKERLPPKSLHRETAVESHSEAQEALIVDYHRCVHARSNLTIIF